MSSNSRNSMLLNLKNVDGLVDQQSDLLVDPRKVLLSASEQEKEDERMWQGVQAFFCNKYSEANDIFSEKADIDPLYALAITTFDENDISLAIENLKMAEKLASAQIQILKSNNSPGASISKMFQSGFGYFGANNKIYMTNAQIRNTVIQAESVLLIALIQLLQESMVSYVKAGLNLRKGYKNYETVWNEINRPGFNTPLDKHTQGGIEFGYGTCNLVLSFLPGKIIRIISAIGYRGNRELGLELLDAALKGRGIRSPLASLLFAASYSIMTSFAPSVLGSDNIPKAESYIRDALKQFPGSDFFSFFEGRNLRLKREIDASTSSFKSVNHSLSTGFGAELRRLCDYELGMNYSMTLQWDNALECFNNLANENYWSPAFFRYFQAACLEMLNRKDEAIALYKEVPTLSVRKFGGRQILVEQYVTRKVKQYTSKDFKNTLLPGLEILLIWNGFASMKEQSLITCLEIVDSRLVNLSINKKKSSSVYTIDSHAILLLIKGSILNQLGKYTEAYHCFNWIFDHNDKIDEEKYILPFTYWEWGVGLYLKGKYDKARLAWEEALEFNGYEFEFR
ncbi:10546_t:CDS:2 [Entrophospora sp. SA101]|nr:10546_t:CDS:2 [Entrophospora sp. SA101]